MTTAALSPEDIKAAIRDIPNFPKPGILFRDITPLLKDGPLFHRVIEQLATRYEAQHVDAVVAIESRGLIFGSALAYRLGVGLIPVRKEGKLPSTTIQATYTLEYGAGVLEVHDDSLTAGKRVVLVDDLLATGGTMGAAIELIEHFRAYLLELAFLVELTALGGRARLGNHPVFSLVQY